MHSSSSHNHPYAAFFLAFFAFLRSLRAFLSSGVSSSRFRFFFFFFFSAGGAATGAGAGATGAGAASARAASRLATR